MPGADIAVRTEELSKLYGTREALVGLDLTVPAGQVFGFLGPNGAGKTTTIGILCTLLRPTLGHAWVAGAHVAREAGRVRRRIGVVFQEQTLDQDLTAMESMRMQAELYGLPGPAARAASTALLDLMGLADRAGHVVRTLSGGTRRRLEIARALVHGPRVLFLDEPTTGLDPQTRAAVREHLRLLCREHGITVFLTTHHLEEAEHCDRIAIIDDGELVAEGSPGELKAVIGADLVTLRTDDDERVAEAVRRLFGVATVTGPGGVRLRAPDGAALVPRLCAELTVPIHSVTVAPPTLDDVFLHHTGRTIR
ncbi:ATP-binding cassette domain-containing protein [Streptomyces capitiformicae]|uniref:ATP-binding cassette domain-containing protein n=1 Tax=Streptomyces capitiformicae TaxID=2014920 RepID=UPI001E51A3AA|nr:ATP-binding cassette domain-containing protein [Streptomyces capitiformicae]